MHATEPTAAVSKASQWAGWIITGLVSMFLLFDGVAKVLKVEPVIKASLELGIPENTIVGIGIVLVVSTILYATPKTSVLGAILLTGYLGGATCTHVRVGGGAFPVVFAVGFGVLAWLGLYLRDPRLRLLIPRRT